jgi:glycerophosphoryl diester phosphodiesterase
MPGTPVSLIFDVFRVRDVPAYVEKGYSIVSLRKTTVSRKLIDACRERGIQAYVWTVDDEEEMRKFISWGVDGIYSNRPGVLKELLRNADFGMRNET